MLYTYRMEQGHPTLKWIIAAGFLLVAGLWGGYYLGQKAGVAQEKASAETKRQLAEQQAASAANPFEQATVNPYSKSPANPYSGVKVNPFQ